MSENNQMMSVEGQLVGMPLAGPESFSQQQLDYLKRALGVDETVLYNNANGVVVDGANVITLNESFHNFELIKIIDQSFTTGGNRCLTVIPVLSSTRTISTNDSWTDTAYQSTTDASKYIGVCFYLANEAGTQITMNGSYITNMAGNGQWLHRNQGKLYKIVGIHRIAGGNT